MRNKQIDTYIKHSAVFAQPILRHLREVVHRGCPGAQETIKWGFPHFEYHGILCSMAAFKEHCAFGFWKASLLTDPEKQLRKMGATAMGNFGRIGNLSDLPSEKILLSYVREAAKLNETGVRVPGRRKPAIKKDLSVPGYFMTTLRKNKKALETFNDFSYTNKKDYVDWVTEAKSEETRNKRLVTAIQLLAEGKIRYWKYQR